MAYNSDGYIMIDFTEVDFRRTNQTIEGLYKRCVDVIGTNKFILVINANGRTPLPATCSFTNNQYVIDTVIYMFAVSSNDNLFIRRNDVPASDIIDDSSISVDKTWSSNKIDSELDTKADASALADYQPLLTPGTNITIDENNVISSTGGAVIDDSVIVNNKVWSSLNTVEKLAPIDTIVTNPAIFKTSLALPLVECYTNFLASQEGTGDPSPANVRNFVPVDHITLTVNGVDEIIDLNDTYYGGSVDVVNVEGINKFKLVDLGAQTWYASATSGVFYCYVSNGVVIPCNDSQLKCNKLKTVTYADAYYGTTDLAISATGQYNNIFVTNHACSTPEEIKSFLTGVYAVIINKESSFVPFSITPQAINTIVGANSIESDTGNIKVSYKYLPEDLF